MNWFLVRKMDYLLPLQPFHGVVKNKLLTFVLCYFLYLLSFLFIDLSTFD